MSDPAATSGIRRVLAAYDAATSDEASLQALAEMAMRLQAELELLFVEDIDLVRTASSPLARQINLATGAAGPLALSELEAEMRAAGARLRRRLADAAAGRQIRWSFRTVRGEAVDEVLLASEAADLLVLRNPRGWTKRRPAMKEPVTVVRRARPSVLLLEHGAEAPRSIFVLFRPGEKGLRALSLAFRLAAAEDFSLGILASDRRQLEIATEQAEAMAGSGQSTQRSRYQVIQLAEDDVLSDAVARAQNGLLVVGADDPVLQGAHAWNRLIDGVCSVMVVRS